MTDVLLNECGDVDVTEGRTSIVRGADAVRQRWLIHIRTFLGEWFLDQSIGVPYYQQVFEKLVSRSGLKQIFRDATLAVPGVIQVLGVTVDNLNTTTREAEITVSCIIEGNEEATFKYTGTIPPEGCEPASPVPAAIDAAQWFWFDANGVLDQSIVAASSGGAYVPTSAFDLFNRFEKLPGVMETVGVFDPVSLILPVLQGKHAVQSLGATESQFLVADGPSNTGKPVFALRSDLGVSNTRWTLMGVVQPTAGIVSPGTTDNPLIAFEGVSDGADVEWLNIAWGIGAGGGVVLQVNSEDREDGTNTATITSSESAVVDGEPFQWTVRRTGNRFQMWINSVEVFDNVESNPPQPKLTGNMYIGINFDSVGDLVPPIFDGAEGDQLGYMASVYDADLAAVESYLRTKWGF